MYTLVLMMALSTSANGPACHRGHGHCCSADYGCASYSSYSGCYDASYSSAAYAQAPGETKEEFDYCVSKQKDMPAEEYSNFRSDWLRLTNDQRKKRMDKDKGKKGGEESSLSRPATMVVTLPADAKLTIDNTVTSSTSANRTFATPTLKAGREFFYTLKAEVVRDGKTFTAIRRVTVKAGEETRVNIVIPLTSIAAR